MNVDDFAKILIVIAISFSIMGISWQTMRLVGVFADSFKDLRKVLQNMGVLSDKFLLDYDFVSSRLKTAVDTVSGFIANVVEPLSRIFSFLGKFKKKSKREENDFDLEEELED